MIADSIQIIFLFGIIGFLANWVAQARGFFTLHPSPPLQVGFLQLFGSFAIYLGLMLFIAPNLAYILISLSSPAPPSLGTLNIVQSIVLLATVFLLYVFNKSRGGALFGKIIKDSSAPGAAPAVWDAALGILTWILSFPIVAVVGQICDLFLYIVYEFENYEQVAVRYLKSNLDSPLQMAAALFMIVVMAPCIEEFLFRGLLQNWLKKHLGFKAGLLIASLLFASFHYSGSQGLGNLSLVASLFVFALFLGFLYERQKSLVASIALHMTFNFASSFRILFVPES